MLQTHCSCRPGCRQENSLDPGDSNMRTTVQICVLWLSVGEVGAHHSDVISQLAEGLKDTSCCDSGHCPRTPHVTHMPGLAPAIKTMRRAMRLCKFHFSTAAATQITPTNSSVVFLKYSAATCRSGRSVTSWEKAMTRTVCSQRSRLVKQKQGEGAYSTSWVFPHHLLQL